MPVFAYRVKDNDGKTLQGTMESTSEGMLIDYLQNEGYLVLDIDLAIDKTGLKTDRMQMELKPTHDRMKLEDLLVFSRQLAILLQAGITMLRSLNIVISQIQSQQLLNAVRQIRDDVEHGSSLSAALAKHPKLFEQFWVSLAEVGEASGTMPRVLNKVADHVEKDAAFRATILSAMIYPLILSVVCTGAVIFFVFVVAPKFEEIFTSMHAQLPLLTQYLIKTSHFLKQYFLWILVVLMGVVFLIRSYIASPFGRLHYEKFIFGLPIVGKLTKLIIVERFAAQMAILVESGVPLLYSLEIAQRMVDNKTCEVVIAQMREGVRQGSTVADAMMEEGFFPVMSIQMIKVGEETGDLAKMFGHVADFYQAQVETFIKRFGTMIEPFLLIFMASIIGVVVVSIFLPLFKLGQGMHAH